MEKPLLVLGIESTCDETASAVVRNGRDILSNVVSSQIDLHRMYGGVVPELACRRHVDVLIPVIQKSISTAGVTLSSIDLIAVSQGPGLVGALLIGINAAKALSLALDKPLIGVNHVEAHLYASLMSTQTSVSFPCLGVVLSGGHTVIVLIRSVGDYTLIGQTVDDAIGESFDKVAKMLNLPYPGGPEIERLARTGDPKRYPFRGGRVKERPLDFSFSGLKTAVLYTLQKGATFTISSQEATERKDADALCSRSIPDEIVKVAQKGGVQVNDLAASFQEAAFRDVITKSLRAAKLHQCSTIVLGGGVTANQHLRTLFAEAAPDIRLLWPSMDLILDNAAMIAGLGFHTFRQKGASSLSLDALTQMPLA